MRIGAIQIMPARRLHYCDDKNFAISINGPFS